MNWLYALLIIICSPAILLFAFIVAGVLTVLLCFCLCLPLWLIAVVIGIVSKVVEAISGE